jgi:Fic family protein
MAFIEIKKQNNSKKYYLAKTFREENKIKKKRVFLGTNLEKVQIDKLSKDALIFLGEIDFENILSKKELASFIFLKEKLEQKIMSFDKKSLYELFISEFTYDSNAIEGSTLTLQETNQVLFENISPGAKPLKNIIEAKNHKEAYDFLLNVKRKKIDVKFICKIQELVTKNTIENGVGELRLVNVRVGVHVAPNYFEVPRKLTALIRWYNSNKDKYNPIIVTAYFHAKFEEIHPFIDGNGRTGRLLINWMLKNYDYPQLIIFFIQRQKYYSALEKARTKKDFKDLLKIFKESYEKILKKLSS